MVGGEGRRSNGEEETRMKLRWEERRRMKLGWSREERGEWVKERGRWWWWWEDEVG